MAYAPLTKGRRNGYRNEAREKKNRFGNPNTAK
jgi:hypothetical protein